MRLGLRVERRLTMAKRRCHHCGTRLRRRGLRCLYCRRSAVSGLRVVVVAGFVMLAAALYLIKML